MVLSVSKSECMRIGPRKREAYVPPSAWYGSEWLSWTRDFKYLGLQFSDQANISHMCSQRLKKAKGTFMWLTNTLNKKGWHHKKTRLILYDLYV